MGSSAVGRKKIMYEVSDMDKDIYVYKELKEKLCGFELNEELLEELEETFTTDEDYLKEHEDDEEIRQLIKKTINEANEDFKDMNKDSKKTLQ